MHVAATRLLLSLVTCFLVAVSAGACGGAGDGNPAVDDFEVLAETSPDVCLPECDGRQCGDDGCGGSCGTCFDFGGAVADGLCREDGTCCAQDCEGKLCGDDGCGGTCGKCGDWGECTEGACSYTPGWTVLVYAFGDNDLEGSMFGQLNQFMTVGSNENLNIVVQIDYVEGMAGRPSDWQNEDLTAGQRLLIHEGEVEVLEEMAEYNSADPQNLADFIEWGIASYPARRYMLILDDHGSAYNGVGSDWTNNSWMSLAGVEKGLQMGLQAAGVEKFDLLFFYACLMGNYEVAHRMQPYVEYMLASEEIAIGSSFRLDRLMLAHDDPEVDTETLAVAILEEYVPTWAKAYPKVTISLARLSLLPEFSKKLDILLDVLAQDMDKNVGDVIVARYGAQKYAAMPFEFYSMHLVDVGGVLKNLLELRPDLQDPGGDALVAYEDVIIASEAGPGHAGSTGLSFFFPPALSYYDEYNKWQDTTPGLIYEGVLPPEGWLMFLKNLLEHVTIDHLGPTFACKDEIEDEEYCSEVSSNWLYEGVESLDLAWPLRLDNLDGTFQASMMFGTLPAGGMSQIDVYADLPAVIGPETGMVSSSFDYQRLVLRQDAKESYGYWDLSTDGGDTRLDVPFFYLVPGSEQLEFVEWRSMLDPTDWTVLEEAFFLRGTDGLFAEFKPAEDAQLYPAVRRADMQWYLYDWDPLYVPFGTVEAIDVAFEQAKPCNTYFYALYVEDEIGRSDVNVANMCKAETESSFQITIKVQAEGTWDDAGAPDFYAEMTFDSIEPVVFDPVPGSHTAEFQFEVGKDKWWGSKLTVGEFDAGKNEIFVKAKVDNYFGYANMLCTRHKKFKYADKSSDRVATVDLTIRKCY